MAEETWLLASRQDRATCLTDETGREYFPHLIVIVQQGAGTLLGMGSARCLSVQEVMRVLNETMRNPSEGVSRQPGSLWLLAMTGPLRLLDHQLAEALKADGAGRTISTTVAGKAPTPDIQEFLDHVSKMLASEHAPKRACHVCDATIPCDTISRCSGCQAVYYCGRACQVKDWKGGHQAACARFKADMAQHGALVALATGKETDVCAFAAETMAPRLTRAGWVNWLEEERMHNGGPW